MQLVRKILFFVFVLIYLVLCPLIILYSFGYILKPGQKEVSQTGVIYLSTIPPSADVYLGDSRFKDKTPTSIHGLVPGKYSVKLKLKGYRSWNKQVNIKAGKAVSFSKIILLPQEFNPKSLNSDYNYLDLIPFPGTKYFILKRGSRFKDFYLYNQRNQTIEPVIKKETEYKNFAVKSIYHQKESKIFIGFGGSLWNKKYFLIDIENKKQTLTDITNLFPEHPDSIIWAGQDRENIFAIYNNHINRLNAKNLSLYPNYIKQIKGFGLSDDWLYVLRQNNTILRLRMDKKDETILFKDRNLGKDLFNQSNFYQIRQLEKQVILFWGDQGDLVTTIPPYHLAKKNIKGVKYSKSREKLIFWDHANIWVADFSLIRDSDYLFKDQAQFARLHNQGANITQCFWVYQGNYILFKDSNHVFLLKAESGRGYHKQHLVRVKKNTKVLYQEDDGYLYYINQNGQVMGIEVVPNRSFFANFIEKENN
jgi:uncharacterized protein (UPF0297 family)